jgi:flagellar motor protein MotB
MKIKVSRQQFKITDKEGFEEAWEHVRVGEKLYSEGKGTFRAAREHYLSAYNYNNENAELNYKLGICYLFTDQKHEAVNYLRKAYVLNNKVTPDIKYMLGRACQVILEFDQAISHYSDYLGSLPPKIAAVSGKTIDRLIEECQNGKILIKDPVRVVITGLSEKVNSPYDDYYSIFNPDNTSLFFTSRRQHSEKAKRSPYDNKFYEGVYVSANKDGEWEQAVGLGKPISNPGHNTAAVGLSPDGNNLFLYLGHQHGGDLYVSQMKNNKWSGPKTMSRFNSKYRETSMCVNKENNELYFISSNEKEGFGGKDIYMSRRNAASKWEDPVNIGRIVNSAYDEEGVSLSADGRTLYFSSKGFNSMGGYDIFKSVKNEVNEWTPPVNLGYPINTPDDELFYSTDEGGKYAYFSANRLGSVGGMDIFRVFYLGSEKEMIMAYEDILIAGMMETKKTGFMIAPEMLSMDTSYILTGKVYDIDSKEGVQAKIDFIDMEQSKVVATTITGDTGAYKAILLEPKNYGVEIVAKDYLLFLDAVDISGKSPTDEIIYDFGVQKVEVGAKVVLENIFFESGKAILKPESFPQLDQVIKFMESNESLRMEISGHTDNVGSLKTNTSISQKRAEAVVTYLVEHGIDASRLDAKGYAFSQPLESNDTPEGRAKNRRVEFKILSK